METWLRRINMLELSPVSDPANLRRKLLQKAVDPTKLTEDPMVTEKALQEYLTKSKLPTDVAGFVKSTIEAMQKAKPRAVDVEVAKKAVADLFGFNATAEEVKKAKEDAEAARAREVGKIVETVKSAVEKLQCENPPMGEIVNQLAELANVTPHLKMLDELPPALKAEWAAMQKSAKDQAEKLVALQKSITAREDEALKASFVAKAKDFGHVPMEPADLGAMLFAVTKASRQDGEKLENLLKSVNEIVEKSALMAEFGTKGASPVMHAAETKIEKIAEQMMQKSTDGLTKEQAIAKALDQNPGLYSEYLAAQQAQQ